MFGSIYSISKKPHADGCKFEPEAPRRQLIEIKKVYKAALEKLGKLEDEGDDSDTSLLAISRTCLESLEQFRTTEFWKVYAPTAAKWMNKPDVKLTDEECERRWAETEPILEEVCMAQSINGCARCAEARLHLFTMPPITTEALKEFITVPLRVRDSLPEVDEILDKVDALDWDFRMIGRAAVETLFPEPATSV